MMEADSSYQLKNIYLLLVNTILFEDVVYSRFQNDIWRSFNVYLTNTTVRKSG